MPTAQARLRTVSPWRMAHLTHPRKAFRRSEYVCQRERAGCAGTGDTGIECRA
jgi:hypothetical protein